jgi:uncharacterized membrane protein YoaK (UPF0700 family)
MPIHPAVARRLFYRQRRWVLPGAMTLAAVAGFVDVAVVSLAGFTVSHMSGTVARIAGDAASGQLVDLRWMAAIILSFALGAMISGMVIGGTRVLPGRRYGVTLLVEAAALGGATWLLAHRLPMPGLALAALACGIQNGMANGFYGVVLRTTHLTGIITDIGVTLGRRLRGADVAWWRVGLLGGILAGFVGGGIGGGAAARAWGPDALLIPTLACLIGGVAYSAWLWRQRPGRRSGSRPGRGGPDAQESTARPGRHTPIELHS